MHCEYCGHANQQGVKFCSNCGAQFPEKPAANTHANKVDVNGALTGLNSIFKQMPVKKILMIAIPVVILIIAAITVIPMLGGSVVAMRKDSINTFSGMDMDQIFISGNNNARFIINGELISRQNSMDGSRSVILTDYDSKNGGVLWFVSTSGSYRIAEDVYSYMLSDTGNGVIYLTDYNSKNNVATLYQYDTSSKKSKHITDEAMYLGYSGMEMFSISPNGKSLSYISDYNEEKEYFTGYTVIDGKAPEKLGDNTFAIAISDEGRTMYYVKMSRGSSNASLHVKSGRNDTRLISDWYNTSLMLNRDYSQIIFNIEDKSYISQNGLERERLDGAVIRGLILPRGSQVGGNSAYANVYGFRSFANNVVRSDDGLAYLDGNLKISKISSTSDNASSAIISSDGRILLYISNNGHLSAIDPTKPGSERKEVGRDVLQFTAANDAKTIYYINDDEELMYVKGGSTVKVSDDVYSSYLAMPFNSTRVFFLVDFSERRNSGELCFSTNGGKRVKVANGEDVTRVWVSVANVFFKTIEEAVYRSNGNEKFELFAEDVN